MSGSRIDGLKVFGPIRLGSETLSGVKLEVKPKVSQWAAKNGSRGWLKRVYSARFATCPDPKEIGLVFRVSPLGIIYIYIYILIMHIGAL